MSSTSPQSKLLQSCGQLHLFEVLYLPPETDEEPRGSRYRRFVTAPTSEQAARLTAKDLQAVNVVKAGSIIALYVTPVPRLYTRPVVHVGLPIQRIEVTVEEYSSSDQPHD